MEKRLTETEWEYMGWMDRRLGNERPSRTIEDFSREIDDPSEAQKASEAYLKGFNS
jgi:hypothetical protein